MIIAFFFVVLGCMCLTIKILKNIDDRVNIIMKVIGHIQAEQHEIKKDVREIKSVNTDQIHQELNKLRLEFPNLRNQIYLNQSKLQEVLNIWAEILKARKK